jgi:tetratricopeptide (TPR) repeat protein
LLADLQEREDRLELEKEFSEPSPFWVETGLYRLLPREYDTFVGRSDLREQAMKAIEGDPRIWIIDLYGPGGVGKSALANWLTYHYHEQNFFEAILQLSAKDTQLSASGMTRLHPTLYSLENLLDSILLLFGHGEYSEQPLDKRSSVVTELLSAFSLLLVLDNMETVRDGRVLEFVRSLPPDTKTKVLMTTRSRTQSWEMPIAVTELNSDEVKEFLRIRSGIMNINLGKNFDDTADCIHKASGGLPLAIQWILGQYNLTGDISSVVAQVRGRESPLLEFSFRNSWILLPEEAQVALAILSIFDEAPTIHIWSTALGWSAEDVERAAYKLAEATFVTKIVDPKTGQETFHALPITLSFAGNELAKMGNLELTARTRYQRHVQEMELVAAETERYTDLFDRFAVERETEKQAVILARKAEPHVGSFNYDEAERLYKMAEEIDPRSVFVLVNYGLLKLSMGHVGEAIRLAERATAYVTRKTGFWVYYNLSQIYAAEKNRDKVEYCLRKALEYSPKHTIARHQLGVAVSKLGKYDEADRIFDELIADELARPSGPSDSLVIAYKTKLISMVKAGRKVEASQVLDMAIRETARWPYLANKAQELTDIF